MKTTISIFTALTFSVLTCAAVIPGSVVYTFDSLLARQATPLLSLAPDVGPGSFLASFTSSPSPNAFQITSTSVSPSFSGLSLIDVSYPPTSASTLTITLNKAISTRAG